MIKLLLIGFGMFPLFFLAACASNSTAPLTDAGNSSVAGKGSSSGASRDSHSYSNPEQVRVRHVDLDLEILFDRKVLKGASTMTIERAQAGADTLKLDTRDLKIFKVEASSDGTGFAPAQFTIGSADKILGAPLTIQLPAQATKVRVEYETAPGASGVQWLEPAQTAGKRYPYVFTQ